MSIFAKKQESDHKTGAEGGGAPALTSDDAARGGYGIAEAIQLLRGLPVDQNPDLVVRVVRATLASLNVHLTDIIDDANKKQKATQERIASEHAKVAELEKQLAEHRKEIAVLEADLKETIDGEGAAADGREGGGHCRRRRAERRQRPARDHAARQQVVRRTAAQGLVARRRVALSAASRRDAAVVLVAQRNRSHQRAAAAPVHGPEQQRDAAADPRRRRPARRSG